MGELPDEQVQWERGVGQGACRDDREGEGKPAAGPPQTQHGVAILTDSVGGQPLAEELDDFVVVEGLYLDRLCLVERG